MWLPLETILDLKHSWYEHVWAFSSTAVVSLNSHKYSQMTGITESSKTSSQPPTTPPLMNIVCTSSTFGRPGHPRTSAAHFWTQTFPVLLHKEHECCWQTASPKIDCKWKGAEWETLGLTWALSIICMSWNHCQSKWLPHGCWTPDKPECAKIRVLSSEGWGD